MEAEKSEKTLEMLRRFIANIGDKEAGMWLVIKEKRVAAFLKDEMDSLTTEERLKVYGFMEGMFPKYFKRILETRL
jgi:hypothetical protein